MTCSPSGTHANPVRFPATVKKLIDGTYQVRSIGTIAGEVNVLGNTREEAIVRATEEIRYRIEWCPCSAVSDEFVELDLQDAPPTPWRGTVF
ncbi:MAG TPA: hypothetical protein VFV14_09510 [Myxococcaceae bacterium]|nr:hypothetical protein [Myxococcaceae bacterium]